jgi:hypothetical protein
MNIIFIWLRYLLVILLAYFFFSFSAEAREFVWRSQFNSADHGFGTITDDWGHENLSFRFDSQDNIWIMKVFIPKGSYDPASMKRLGLPRGGAGFKLNVLPTRVNSAILTYRVRFAKNFYFVRGGKLPGLFGGRGNSGGIIPNGTDGFSFRLMWGPFGEGTVYAYLPTSVKYGTPLLFGKLLFKRGRWQTVRQEVVLNHPGKADGFVKMWIDGKFLGEAAGLIIRTVDTLKINGMFFDVFFGGDDPSWASARDTYIEFADFVIRADIE